MMRIDDTADSDPLVAVIIQAAFVNMKEVSSDAILILNKLFSQWLLGIYKQWNSFLYFTFTSLQTARELIRHVVSICF